jgi:hypothetical protein
MNLARYKDEMLSNYCKSLIVDKEMVGKYLIGLETSMIFSTNITNRRLSFNA